MTDPRQRPAPQTDPRQPPAPQTDPRQPPAPQTGAPHPVVRLAMGLVNRPAPAEPELTDAGRDQLRAALRDHRAGPERQAAALALLELALFLATEAHGRAAADAIGAVVAAEAGDELRALGAEWQGRAERESEAAKKLLGAAAPVHARPEPPQGIGRSAYRRRPKP